MEKETFSVIIVPHDIKKTRTYKIPYRLFYLATVFAAIGVVAMLVFIATYGRLLVKTRETLILQRQVTELTRRNAQIGELVKDLSELHAMDLKVRQMLGLEMARADSVALADNPTGEDLEAEGIETEKSRLLMAIPSFWPARG
ncbi:MAG TPA: hypothetical protein VLA34_14690, partial [Candidatus Krumholzibacterium sp.]|nr:hypothetical protein [Candidatus Krumholzibacterium sp.]